MERDAPDTTRPDDESPAYGLRQFSGLFFDVGAPLVAYYALRLLGATEWVALLVATVVAGVRITWVAVRTRQVTWFAGVMLAVFGVGLALSFVDGDPRFLLVTDSFTTAMVGLVFLASLLTGKPLTLSAFQTSQPQKAREMEEFYRTIPPVRRTFRVSAVVWGVGLLLLAIVRIPLIYLLPLDVMVGLSTGLLVAVIVGLSIWNGWYGARTGPRAQAWAEANLGESTEGRPAVA
ncbi:VC0807 family protein [Actinomycetospora aeridis]|uniref:VC0807 family protein n=1 Tax=Actinomycetospora aeridis TaxID=3129231 RepID=A0ABU8N8R0_9PSEU